jgi:aspartyl protease
MQWTSTFDPAEGVVWITAHVIGPLGSRDLNCILDTGTSHTILDTSILDELGYGARMGTRLFGVSGIGGLLPAYELPLARFELMGLELEQFPVLSQDIVPDNVGVDGLIGMDVLAGRILTIDACNGTVSLTA